MREDREKKDPLDWLFMHPGTVMILVLVLSFAGWVFSSHMEAKAYERATGEYVSTWDAMWIELRVQSEPGD